MPSNDANATGTDALERRKRLARLLLEKSYREGDFTLTSGKKSDYYFDCRQTALHPEGAFLMGHLLLDMLLDGPAVQAVAGPTLGADPLVTSIALISHLRDCPLPALIVRKKPKGYGAGQCIEGLANVTPGSPVAMIEDVVTTGGSVLDACQRVKEAGLVVVDVICVLDRQEGGTEALRDAGWSLRTIFTRAELLEAGR